MKKAISIFLYIPHSFFYLPVLFYFILFLIFILVNYFNLLFYEIIVVLNKNSNVWFILDFISVYFFYYIIKEKNDFKKIKFLNLV